MSFLILISVIISKVPKTVVLLVQRTVIGRYFVGQVQTLHMKS